MIGSLFDHLWQSTLFAGAVGLLILMLGNNSARVRFWLWFAASAKFLLPFAALTALSAALVPPSLPPLSAPVLSVIQPAAEPFAASVPFLAEPVAAHFDPAPFLLLIWGLGIAAVAGWRMVPLLRLRRLCAAAADTSIVASVKIKRVPGSLEPGLAGIWRPVILLPEGIETHLLPEELNAVLAHELCHFKRRDNLLAAIHMLVETLFWFHPLIWWLSTRLEDERERACDEMVLAGGGAPHVYAESILKVCKFYMQSPLSCLPGVSGADLKKRVRAIMQNRLIESLDRPRKAILAGAIFIAMGVPVAAALVMPADMFAEDRAGPSPGTEAALRHQIVAWQRRRPDFGALTPAMALAFSRAQAQVQGDIDRAGPLKSITFERVSPEGWDVYSVAFTNLQCVWNVAPLTADGKIPDLGFHRAFRRDDMTRPSPGTEVALRRQIEGWERHRPDFDDMSATLRANMKRQYAMGQTFFDALGPLKSIVFTRVSANGWDVYDTRFENGRVDFSIGPLSADGKVDFLGLSPTFDHSGTGPSPGTEASLARYIAGMEKDTPDYGEMTPVMAALVRLDWPARAPSSGHGERSKFSDSGLSPPAG